MASPRHLTSARSKRSARNVRADSQLREPAREYIARQESRQARRVDGIHGDWLPCCLILAGLALDNSVKFAATA